MKKGLNFAITPEKVPVDDFVVNIEEACSKVPTNQAEGLRNEAVAIISNHKIRESNIMKNERKAIKELSKNKEILILPADKGRATVLLDRTTYEEKMLSMLSDTTHTGFYHQTQLKSTRRS